MKRWLARDSGSCRGAGGALVPDRRQAHARAPLRPRRCTSGCSRTTRSRWSTPPSRKVLGTIPVPAGPHGLVLTPDGRKVYVSSDGDSHGERDRHRDRSRDGDHPGRRQPARPRHRARRPARAGLGVGEPTGRCSSTPRATRSSAGSRSRSRTTAPSPPTGERVGRLPAAGRHRPRRSSTWSPAPQVGVVPLDKTPRALDLSPDGRWLYFTVAGSNAVMVLDTASASSAWRRSRSGPRRIRRPSRPTDGPALVVEPGPGRTRRPRLGEPRRALAAPITVGKTPHWVAISRDGRTAFVTNEVSGDLSVVDVADRRVLATIPVGTHRARSRCSQGRSARRRLPRGRTRAPAQRRPPPITAPRTSGACRRGGSRSTTTTSRRRSCAAGRASACTSSWRAARRRCTT